MQVLLALPLAMASAATLASEAPQAPASPAPPAASTSSAPAADALRYRVVIEAPEPLRDTLSSSVDLIRWQDEPRDPEAGERLRLADESN